MAAADITVNRQWATIECDAVVRTIDSGSVKGSLLITGANAVFLRQGRSDSADLARDGVQVAGEIEAQPGDTIPISAGERYVQFQCLGGQASKMLYFPDIG